MKVLYLLMYVYGAMATLLAIGFVVEAPSVLTIAMLVVSVAAAPAGHAFLRWDQRRR